MEFLQNVSWEWVFALVAFGGLLAFATWAVSQVRDVIPAELTQALIEIVRENQSQYADLLRRADPLKGTDIDNVLLGGLANEIDPDENVTVSTTIEDERE